MKRISKIVLALVTAVSLFCCKNQMEKEEINYDKVEIALKEMQQTQTDAVNSIYDKLIEINSSELCKSSVFEEYPSPTRNILNDSEILSEDEEEIFINSMSDKQKEEIIKTAQIYFDKYSEIAKIRVFDENDIPDGLVETDEAVYIGDMVYSKMTPDGLSRVYELAKAYYDVEKSNRGAYLGVKVSLNSVPVFQAAWPSGKIAYAFDDFPSKYKSEMRKCMDEWEIGSNNLIKFSETSSFNWWRNIWWTLGTLRVVKISKKDLSCTGKATPGYCLRPYLYIDKNTFNKSKDARLHTFRHELGHVLGLQHEFDRIDRDKYVVISENSNWSDFSVPGIGRIFIGSIGSYDFNSVMNYSNFYHIKNSDGTKGSMISLNDILDISEGDKSTIRHLYGAGGYIY